MITICCDFSKKYQGKNDSSTWIAQQIQDYIPLRQHLRRALDDPDRAYIVYVQHRVLAEWLRDLRAYPSYLLRWEEVPTELLPSSDLPVKEGVAPENLSLRQRQQQPSDAEPQGDRIQVLSPQVKLEGYLQSGRTTPGRVIVFNPNKVTLFSVKLKIDSVESLIEWPALEPNSQYGVGIQFLASKIKSTQHQLVWKLTCEGNGRLWEFEDYIEVPVRQFQTSEVDTMFEGLS